MENILFATDLHEASQSAFHYTLLLAQQMRSQVFVLHVYKPARYLNLNEQQREAFRRDEYEDFLKRTEKYARIYPNMADPQLVIHADVHTEVRKGSAAEQIMTAASEHEADLIVISARQKQGVFNWLYGSVPRQLIYEYPAPILIIPDDYTPTLPGSVAGICLEDAELQLLGEWLNTAPDILGNIQRIYLIGSVGGPLVAPGTSEMENVVHHGGTFEELITRIEEGKIDLVAVRVPLNSDDPVQTERNQLIQYLYDHLACPLICIHL